MANPHEALARQSKAQKIVDTLAGHGITHAQMLKANETTWNYAALLANVNHPSQDTQAVVMQMLKQREAAGA